MERVLKTIWNEFIHGGHLVALGSVIIVLAYIIIRQLPPSWLLIIGIYLIIYIIHLLDRYNDLKNESSVGRVSHYRNYKGKIIFIAILSFLSIIAVFANKGLVMVIIAILLLLLGLIYGIFFKKITRYIIGFKSYYTALAFASVIIFTTYYYHLKFDSVMLYIYFFFTLRWFCNTTFCDIKDIKQDRLEGLKTFAVSFEKKTLYRFFYLVNIVSLFPLLCGVYLGVLPAYSLILGLSALYYFYYLSLSRKEGVDFQKLANVWADGESIVWLVLIVIGRFLWG